MKHYSWEEFYANYEDWQPGELWANTFGLKEFGPSNQVADVICLMECYYDDAGTDYATKFAEMAYESGVRFTPDDLIDLSFNRNPLKIGQSATVDRAPDVAGKRVDDGEPHSVNGIGRTARGIASERCIQGGTGVKLQKSR